MAITDSEMHFTENKLWIAWDVPSTIAILDPDKHFGDASREFIAKEICRRWNSWRKLLVACKAGVEALEFVGEKYRKMEHEIDQLKGAIAAAEKAT